MSNPSLEATFQEVDPSHKQTYFKGLFMWFMLFLGYALFTVNWFIFSRLEGNSSNQGWVKAILGEDSVSQLVSEAVMYSIFFARAFASIAASYIIFKLTHKYAALLAFILTTFAFPLVFSPHFAFLIIGRIFMAIGGSLLIIYTQPIIAQFFSQKNKATLSTLNNLAYSLSALILNCVFLSTPLVKVLTTNWKLTTGITGALTFIPLILYALFSINFDVSANKTGTLQVETAEEVSYSSILKQKRSWVFFLFYSFSMVVSISISNTFPKIVNATFNNIWKTGLGSSAAINWTSLYIIFFYSGVVSGMSLGMFTKRKMQRTPVVQTAALINLMSWLIIVMTTLTLTNYARLATAIILPCAFLCGFFGLGISAVALYIPHEYKDNTPKKTAIFFSLLWGMSYLLYALYSVIIAGLRSVPRLGDFLAIIALIILLFSYWTVTYYMEEPRPEWPVFSMELIDPKPGKVIEAENLATVPFSDHSLD